MESKRLITLLTFVGGTIGGYLPVLWGGSAFSFSSILLSAVGAVVGIYFGWKMTQ